MEFYYNKKSSSVIRSLNKTINFGNVNKASVSKFV